MRDVAPYQILFPIGVLGSLLAVGLWLIPSQQLFGVPVMFIHSKLIVSFIWAFIVGFLMTAIPRMSGTSSASLIEKGFGTLLIITQYVLSFFFDPKWFYFASFITVLCILFFGGRRVIKASKPIPVFFSHVGIAMVLALLGSFYQFKGDSYMGFHLYHLGVVLLLVLGIGARFYSFLSGLPSLFEQRDKKEHFAFHLAGVSVAALLYLSGKGYTWSYFLLSVLMTYYMIFVWKVFRVSSRNSALKIAVRFIALFIPLGFFMSWLQPGYYIAWFHLIFIGCFGVIIYAVATRVTLAHGAYSTDLETKSRSLWWMLFFFISALFFRVSYAYLNGEWKSVALQLAVTFWTLAIGVWCVSFLLKVFLPGDQERPSC